MAMTNAAFKKRTQEVLREESTNPYLWHYCSFADEVFRGVVILQAHGTIECAIRARSLNANPGGELMAVPMPDEIIAQVPESFRNRLLTKDEVQQIWPDAKTIREHEADEATSKA